MPYQVLDDLVEFLRNRLEQRPLDDWIHDNMLIMDLFEVLGRRVIPGELTDVEDVLSAVRNNYDPGQVFSEEQLIRWARDLPPSDIYTAKELADETQ